MKNTYLQIRISDKDKEALKAQAEANQMTMSEYIVYLIRMHADKE